MRFFAAFALVLLPMAGIAQTADEDEGFLTELIQDNLSGGARTVDVQGFAGALSSEATIERLTIADAEGIWLTVDDIVLSWNRRALLRGAIDVQELSAAKITLARAPISEDTGPTPEAAPFTLPELPVSVSLDALDIAEIVIGEAFLGEVIRVSLTGAAQLADGEGSTSITANRLDDTAGVFEITGAYVNETRFLDLLVKLEEGADGIVANLLDLPGSPALALEIAGAAPLDNYTARIAVATDGQDRLLGSFSLAQEADAQTITLDVAGDISPLFAPEYKGFFGDDANLAAQVVRSDDGRIAVPELALDAGRVALNGELLIDAQGWPEVIDLRGGITPLVSEPVLLPLTGPQTFVDGMDLIVAYNGALSDEWRADIRVAGLTRPGLAIETVGLKGGGLLRSGSGDQVGALTVDLTYGATGLSLADAGAAEAFGDSVEGSLVAARLEGDVTNLSRLSLSGAGLDALLSGTIAGPDAGFQADMTLAADVAGLERFATLIGQDLSGGAALDADIRFVLNDGSFDVALRGQTQDLSVGIAQADAILAGTGQINARAVRDTEGTRLEALEVTTDAARVQATADLTSNGADAQIDMRLNDLGLVVTGVSGPASVTGNIIQNAEGAVDFTLSGTAPSATFATEGKMTPSEDMPPLIVAEITADLRDISRYAEVIGQPASGAVAFAGNGALRTDLSMIDVALSGRSDNLVTGLAQVDPLLAGAGRFAAQVARDAQTPIAISNLALAFPQMALTGEAALAANEQVTADLEFQIVDAALISPTLEGPLTVAVTAMPTGDDATDATLRAQGVGIDIDADVTVASAANDRQISGEVKAQVAALSAFADLVGQPIAGALDMQATGSVLPDLTAFEAQVNLTSQDLAVGVPTVDVLLTGEGAINAAVGLAGGVLGVRTLEVSTDEVFIVGALNGAAGFGQGRFNASLRDVGVLTDQISGPVRATGAASLDEAGNWGVDANATGPGGLQAQIAGEFAANGTLDMEVDGSAPLALANTAIDPRRLSGLANFDLRVNGPPALSSLGGQITFSDGRLAAPNLGQALTDIGGQITIAGGTAQIGLTTRVEAGGGITVIGPLALTGNNQADIAVTLQDITLQDPELYATTVSGRINLTGPLQGGARIGGELTLGQTDIQVPSSSISSLGSLPDVVHVNAPSDVRRTLSRAGLLATENGEDASGGGPAFPLNIVINAPSRIFIRGRGLDAELGGRLTIGGTSSEVIPTGRFELVRGRLDILQQRFELSEGIASLQGDFVPFLRLVAQTETDNGTTVNIIVEGPAGEPEVSFTSIPELPQDEVLAQLIFGRDLDSISPLQAIQLAAAVSTLAGNGGGVLERLRAGIGLDDFDVTTDDEGNAAVRAGAYLSENVYTDVTVTSEGDTEINLNLDITREITAKGSVDQDGETSIGVFFERDY